MSENESRPLERWSMAQIRWSGRTADVVNAYKANAEISELRAKAAAMDRTLAAWGMTWEEYQTGTDAPAHGREPNVDSEETRVEAGGTGQAREPRTETEAR